MRPVIGFTNKYYTLWHISEPQLTYSRGGTYTKVYYQYIQNLSFDVESAREKMVERYGEGNFGEDFELRASRSFYVTTQVDVPKSTTETKFQFGKYAGQDFVDVDDLDYKLWYVRAAGEDKKPLNLIGELIYGGHLFSHDGVLVTSDELIERVSYLMETHVYERGLFHKEGEKVELTLRVRWTGGINSRFGYISTVGMVDDETKKIYLIKGTNPGITVGDVVVLKGTVKWEDYYSDWHDKQVISTVLKRPKVVKWLQMSELTKERLAEYV